MNRRNDTGFALVTTLWFLALLAIVTVIVEGWIVASVGRAAALRERVRADAVRIGAADRLAFLMVTGDWSRRGLEPAAPAVPRGAARPDERPAIALDGRPYRLGRAVVRLQDEGGLYDLSNPDRGSLTRLLAGYGVALPDADRLAKALIAYQRKPADPAAGDEAARDYAGAGLPLPRDARLLTPWEPYRILGWPQQTALWRGPSSLADIATTGPVGGLGINTAPARVLAAVTGIDEDEAARLVADRAQRPLAGIGDIPGGSTMLAGTVDGQLAARPSAVIRLRLLVAGDPLEHIVSVRLTPGGPTPYRVDYAVALPQAAGGGRSPDAAPDLPTPQE